MLTKRQNLLETIRGGNPDRFVNQWEAFGLVSGDPIAAKSPRPLKGQEIVNSWGVTIRFPENTPGPFPVHDYEHKVIKDITKWKETVKAPSLDAPTEAWDAIKAQAAAVDRNEKFLAMTIAPGIFEQVHYLMGMDDTLLNFYEEPEAMHELIDFITDWKIEYSKLLVKHIKPEVIIHHDDWGSQINSFLSPEMFAEFIVPAFKKLYGFYKANGVQLIVHHSDSYGANLVPYMIEMGIDIWQGAMTANNIPKLIKKYGGQISFMGDINNGVVDVSDWTPELIAREVERACRSCGKLYFIPNTTMGGPMSTYPGVYEAVSAEIDRMNKILF
ncbi:methylcobalamin:coenzyme M methyltransferase [Oxobacter pfennigii]|uniref:Methylcobalamin:coenzyme M methyltransferase n=1 Tax=Oxobacter pfennigii TaxID=36849 RepID=A0A0P8W6R2_9CLOT|nr:uroporphyrinogen decarboxylase family protein [Oxobacter pfennigii]KPU44409.1 methylcobalamin:coenzyme M methyltransferase [Oxobacter pfennigii]